MKELLINVLKKELKQDFKLEIPPNPRFGDFALPCFNFSKEPNKFAKELSEKLKRFDFIEDMQVMGPYLNFFLNKNKLAETTINEILNKKTKYGSLNQNENILVEHTSINPNASPHVGRARNALIGDSTVRILRFNGNKVDVHYFINDVGKQIAMLVYASKGKKPTFENLLHIYVEINKKMENKPEIEQEIFSLLREFENGNQKVRKEFKKIVDICVKGQLKIFNELDIKYNKFDYESKYLFNKDTQHILEQLPKTGKLFTDTDGRQVLNEEGFNLAMKSPVLVLTRNDGTSLYPLRDIAYTLEKMTHGKNLIILGEDQKLYFQQINSALILLGKPMPKVIHYSFVSLKEGSMSTRAGNVVLLSNFMEEALKKARSELKARYKKINEKLAKQIAYGAIKYSILKTSPEKNVVFDMEEALSFEGDSSPYLQYAHARANSIIKKVKSQKGKFTITIEEEREVVIKLLQFKEIIKQTKPSLIANYSFELAKKFNELYHKCPISTEKDKNIKFTRLMLVKATIQVLKNSLNLLGIEAPEKM